MLPIQRSEEHGLRHRMKKTLQESLPSHGINMKFRSTPPGYLNSTNLLVVFGCLGLIYLIIVETEKQLPVPIMIKEEQSYPGRFIAERAMNHILNLTSLGPRPTGSFENEVLAVNFLMKEINSVIKKANKVHRISLDIQKTSGSFPLQFLDGMTNVYRNVQNVIAKIGPLIPSPYSLLINCHFDTVADSPGGSDDSASCAVMLEMLRVISQSDRSLSNNIIFLFNGAEENLMQASHGFITQHNWAKEVKAFINLEACGAGGRELLFQAGPENPWLMQAYSESVPYPLASSLAQEVFQSGLIPGDTDYRIFRDFGNIPGLDFAWSTNGYVYHTKMDDAAHIPLGSLQRTGDNMLPLALTLASAPYPNHHPLKGNLVFFDVLGAFIFRIPEYCATLIGLTVVFFSFYTVYSNFKHTAIGAGMSSGTYVRHLFLAMASILISWLLSLALSAFIASLLTLLNRTMSWFSRPIWVMFLYVIPSILMPLLITSYLTDKQKKRGHSTWTFFCIYNYGNQLIWTLALIVCIILGVRSGFIPAMWLLFASTSNFLREKCLSHWRGWKLLTFYVGLMLFPFIQGGYIINGALLVIIPIMGRSGSGNHSELVLGLITCAMFILLLNFLVPMFVLICDIRKIASLLIGTVIVALLTLILTPCGFPYSSDPASPALQRYMILHVERIFHGTDKQIKNHTGGFWVVDLDANSPRSVSSLVPDMANAQPITTDCENHLYCGLPYIIPVLTLIWKTHWIPYSPPVISVATNLELSEKKLMPNDIMRYKFTVVGPDHMNVMVSPVNGVELVAWSLVEGPPLSGPMWNGRKTYFVYYSCASNPEPWNFSIDLKIPADHISNVFDIALGGHFLHGAHQSSVKLNKFLSHFPLWTVTSGWTATYKSYIF